MADQSPGTPQIVFNGDFGQQEKVEIDSNRLDQQKETNWEFLQRLAFPASVAEIQLQAQQYLFAGWFCVGLLLLLIEAQLYVVVAVFLLALIPSLAFTAWLSERYKSARVFLRYRLLLLAVGGFGLGFVPLSQVFQFVKELLDRAN